MKLNFECESRAGISTLAAHIHTLVIAGWAGRDKGAMEHHIAELEALGVRRPEATPTFYRVAASRLSTAEIVEDAGANGSGEIETFILALDGRLYVGAGSDHTDRQVETYGVTVSKQMCDKPIASRVWPLDEVKDHWDSLILRSHVVVGGERHLYQQGSVVGLLPPETLMAEFSQNKGLTDGTVLFGGTLAAIGGIRHATRFEGELEDPVLARRISFGYSIESLPIRG